MRTTFGFPNRSIQDAQKRWLNRMRQPRSRVRDEAPPSGGMGMTSLKRSGKTPVSTKNLH